MQNNTRINKKYAILTLVAVLLGIIFWLLSSYSYIDMTITNSANSNATIQFKKPGSDPSIFTTTQKNFKKLVKKGTYEITVKSDKKNSFNVITTGGFLTAISVNANLLPEKNREFIGSNPRPCMNLTPIGLLSYGCGDKIAASYIHVPANSSTPTYTKPLETTLDGYIEGVVNFQNQEYIFVKSAYEAEDQAPHAAFKFKDDATLGTIFALDDLDEDVLYNFYSFKNGLLAVSSNYREAYYYTSLTEAPRKININHPDKNKKYYPYDIDVFDDTIVIGFTDTEIANNDAEDSKSTPKSKGSVVLFTNEKAKKYSLNKIYDDIQICERNRLCMLVDGSLSVTDVSSDKQKVLYSISDVNSIKRTPLGLIIARNNEVINMNISRKTGSMDFLSKNNSSCGIQSTFDGYVLCISNSRDESNALHITAGEPNDIELYVSKLLELPEVKTISVYKKYIYISPNLGKYAFNPTTKTYGYDPVKVSTVNAKIDEKIKSLNADPRYIFINPFR